MSGRACRFRREGKHCSYGCTAERTLCHHYLRERSCKFGDTCRYLHVDNSCMPPSSASSDLNAERRQHSVSRSPRRAAERAAEPAADPHTGVAGSMPVISGNVPAIAEAASRKDMPGEKDMDKVVTDPSESELTDSAPTWTRYAASDGPKPLAKPVRAVRPESQFNDELRYWQGKRSYARGIRDSTTCPRTRWMLGRVYTALSLVIDSSDDEMD